MAPTVQQRIGMALLGALAGLSFYLLAKVIDEALLAERLTLALSGFAVVFFAGALSMAGPMRLLRAALASALLGALVAALLSVAGLRYASVTEFGAFPLAAAFVLATLPMPFVMAAAGAGWRDYSSLFTHAWGMFVRLSLAFVFVGVVWGMILLSDALFALIGLTLITDLLAFPVVPFLLTGMTFGLALAVVNELSDYVSPYLILRLLRLLVLPVLVVLVVFVAALPLRGLSGLFGGLSSAATLLAMAAAAVTLVSAAVDQEDGQAVAAGLGARAAQALALVLVVPAALAAWALWLRVGQYGWTPGRLFGAWMAALALGYGGFYAAAVLRGNWRARIRSANVTMALGLIGSAALWLGVISPEAISTRSQIARFDASGDVKDLELYTISQWGLAGAAARADLEARAKLPGQEALAAALAGDPVETEADAGKLRADLVAILPLQPATATATRDAMLAAADPALLSYWLASCQVILPAGPRACAMVVADLWTDAPGEEALMVISNADGFMSYSGLTLDAGNLVQHGISSSNGFLPEQAEGAALLAALQRAAPAVQAAPFNLLRAGQTDMLMLP